MQSSGSETVRDPSYKYLIFIFFLFLFYFFPLSCSFAGDDIVKIGVLAKRGAEKCLEKWTPTADYLSGKIPGKSFIIVPLDFEQVHPAVKNGQVDFILANSSFYVALEFHYGVDRIATLKNLLNGKIFTTFGGVIFCRKDRHDLRKLKDLKGCVFMGVKESSFGGFQMAWRELKEKKIDPYTDFAKLRFGGTHDAVVYAVKDRKVDAGTVRTDTLERMAMEGKIRLDDFYVFHEHGGGKFHLPFLHSTREYPEWPLAKVKHTSTRLAEKVLAALLDMAPDSPAAKASLCGGWTIPLNYQPVHECLRILKAGPYKNIGRITINDVIRVYKYWILAILILFAIMTSFLITILKLNRNIKVSHGNLKKEVDERRNAEEKLKRAHYELEKRVEERTKALSISEHKYRRIFEASQDMILSTGEDGCMIDLNPAGYKMLGLTCDTEIKDKKIQDFFAKKEDWEAIKECLYQNCAISSIEVKLIRPDKTMIRALISGSLDKDEPDPEGKSTIYFVAKDIERRKLMEKQLAHADRLASIGELAAGIAHEINNPLGIILGYTQLLIRNADPKTEIFNDLRTIERHVKSCQLIVNDLLNFARSSKPEKSKININRLVDEVVDFTRQHSDDNSIIIDRSYDQNVPSMLIDEKKIKQVLLNLIMNARHATGEKGVIHISTILDSENDEVIIKVADSGYGIEKKNLTRIFDPFFTTKTTGEGTGLGLSVSYGIIKNHGGDILVESKPGKGSVFSVVLPVKAKSRKE